MIVFKRKQQDDECGSIDFMFEAIKRDIYYTMMYHMCVLYSVLHACMWMVGSSEREKFTFTLESQLYSCYC